MSKFGKAIGEWELDYEDGTFNATVVPSMQDIKLFRKIMVQNTKKKDIAGRIGEAWTVRALADAMIQGLEKDGRPVPPYLKLLAAEETAQARGIESALFGMG